MKKFGVKPYVLIAAALSLSLMCMTACSSAQEKEEIKPITEETYTDDMFYWEEEQLLYIDGSSAYYYVPEKNIYFVCSSTQKGAYATYLYENSYAYFTTYDEDLNFYVDFPNDSKGFVMVRKAQDTGDEQEIPDEKEIYYTDENGNQYYKTPDGQRGGIYNIQTHEIPFDNGNVDVEELSYEQAQKIAVLSVMHDAAVKRYEEKGQ